MALSRNSSDQVQANERTNMTNSNDGLILVRYDGQVARLVIDRPAKRNAISLSMWLSIPTILREIRAQRSVQLLIVEGQGDEAFSAGADIEELLSVSECRQAAENYLDAIRSAEAALGDFDLPTLACIRGFCMGGGLELAMACDLRVATSDSRFAAPPARLGITYSTSSTRRLASLVGESRAKELLFSAREIDAFEACQVGLINQAYMTANFEEHCAAYVERMLRNSQRSIHNAKLIFDAIRHGAQFDSPEVRELRVRGFNEVDFKEGVDAFHAGRPANFTWGRG